MSHWPMNAREEIQARIATLRGHAQNRVTEAAELEERAGDLREKAAMERAIADEYAELLGLQAEPPPLT